MGERTKKDDLVYIQRDLEAIKHTLDKVLRPYKSDVRSLRAENLSLREGLRRADADKELLLRFIDETDPSLLETALAVLLDPKRSGWEKFRDGWLRRLAEKPKWRVSERRARLAGER